MLVRAGDSMLTALLPTHRELFQALDVDQEGTLSMKEAAMGDGKFKLLALVDFSRPLFSVKCSEADLEEVQTTRL